MDGRVLLTIDTELTWGHFERGCSWEENFARSYDPAGVGVPFQLELLRRHGLKACFFVDPMPALVYGIEPVRRMVEPILAAGQDVQLHLHSFWLSVAQAARPSGFELTCFDAARQLELIGKARDLLLEAGAPPPIAFRSGSYAANADTLDALAALGIGYDSSHNGCWHPDPSNLPLRPSLISPAMCRGLVEVPVSQIEDRPGQLRHLQICAVSSAELEAALRHAARERHPVTTLVSHSFELATRDGLRPNRLIRGRFERLCAFLDAHRHSLPTTSFAGLADVPLEHDAEPLPARPLRRARRVVEQVWAGARYEHPGQTATAAYGSSISGVELLVPLIGL